MNVTASQMIDKAHELADIYFPEWTDRSKSDFGEFLVELFALFSEKDFWYVNAFANEGVLRKMRSYSNVFSKVISMGYSPVLCKGSQASFNVTFDAGGAVTYGRGDLVIKVGEKKFSNDNSFNVEASAGSLSQIITLSEGTQAVEDVTFNGYSIFLRKPNIDIDSIRVTIGNISYTRVKTFGFSDAASNHFMVLPEEDGSVVIYFGDGTMGVRPSVGISIHVEYRTCAGSDGNIELDEATISDSLPEREASAVVMTTDAEGGTFAESMASMKEKAPLNFGLRGVASNVESTEQLLKNLPFVHKVKAQVAGMTLVYSVIPTSGMLDPSASQKQTMEDLLSKILILGFTSNYENNNYVDLRHRASLTATKIIVDVVVSKGYDLETISTAVKNVVTELTDPFIGAEYGGSFTKTEADIYIRSKVPGVLNTSFKMLDGGVEQVMPDIYLNPLEIFSKISSEYLEVRINVA